MLTASDPVVAKSSAAVGGRGSSVVIQRVVRRDGSGVALRRVAAVAAAIHAGMSPVVARWSGCSAKGASRCRA